jgi:hypothetical protein
MKNVSVLAAACSLALLWPVTSTIAQDAQPGQRGRRGNPDEFRKQMEERIKTAMKATDEEWAVLQPLIEKVSEKGREAMAGRFGGGFGRGPGGPGGGAPGGTTTPRPGSEAAQALREAVEKEGASNEDLQAKMNAVREQRKKAQAELEAAREELKKMVTIRQEAVLVAASILE